MQILLETNFRDKDNQYNYSFSEPVFIINCHSPAEMERAFDRMERALEQGYYLAGFLSYEAGHAFEKNLRSDREYGFPLLCFGAYRKWSTNTPESLGEGGFKISAGKFNLSPRNYATNIKKIKSSLAQGDSYQVNYTFKYKFKFSGSPAALYSKLKQNQSTPYSALIQNADLSILSLSPELFFRKRGGKIQMKPMKGTAHPGKAQQEELCRDPKNRSENLMIVDLIRNDLGRIAGSRHVNTRKLFETESYKTLSQMTSTIEASIPCDIKIGVLFRSLFPSGSVTGAPKIRTMQIIKQLEKEERKIYTGSIGFITPEKDMVFNVAIRTILLTTRDTRPATYEGEMGLGSGVIYESDPREEYAECLLKADFLTSC